VLSGVIRNLLCALNGIKDLKGGGGPDAAAGDEA
jgi:hypothetical protein